MWAKRIAALTLTAALLAGLASCARTEGGSELLIKPVESAGQSGNLRLAQVELGSITRSYSTDGSIRYKERTILCEYDGAKLEGFRVSAGDTVQKGDVIADISVDYSQAELQSLEAELAIAESSAERQKQSAADAVTAARAALDGYTGQDARQRQRLTLALERAEISRKLAVQSADRSVAAAASALDAFTDRISPTAITAPADGYLSTVEFKGVGSALTRGSKICTLVVYDDVSLGGSSELSGAMRYGQTVTVSGRALDAPFDSTIIAAPNVEGQPTGNFSVAIPQEILKTFTQEADSINPQQTGGWGGRPSATLPSGLRIEALRLWLEDVPVVPSSAIQTEDGKRFVYVLRDGELRKRFIATGASDDKNTQILDGISVGEQISLG